MVTAAITGAITGAITAAITADLLVAIAGWGAAVLIIVAYGLLTAGRLDADSRAYQWMNVVGAIGFIVNSGWNRAWPSAALNVAWAAIGVFALWKIATRPTSST